WRVRDRRTVHDAAGGTGAPSGGAGRGGTKRIVGAAGVAGALLAGSVAWLVVPGATAGAPVIRITAHHSRFEPDRLTVKANATVRIVVHNSDPIDHEFIIGPPAVHELHERGTPHFHTGVTPGEITVPAGATVETSWTFGPSGSPAVAYGCHLAGHWAYGMHGLATIR
ncbi:MAG TPA: cupredoxin domain-containing protein, partial [Acidimicrobiia bacterium]|nr:cupredoxin domain-containing protein [Acidimicrobiia bacterium]